MLQEDRVRFRLVVTEGDCTLGLDPVVYLFRLASQQLKPIDGLNKICQWEKDPGFKRAAVTNAPRENAELMISIIGLSDFFQLLVVGSECDRANSTLILI